MLSLYNFVYAENISIESKKITIDKKKQITIFEEEVILITDDNKTIKGEYAEYDKEKGKIILKDTITLIDQQNNKIVTEYAEYFEKKKLFQTKGPSKIFTRDGYIVVGENFIFDNIKNLITSNLKTVITDNDQNTIFLQD